MASPQLDEDVAKILNELVERARRTETRVTKVANHLGVEAGGTKSRVDGGRIIVPSRHTTLEDILKAAPSNDRYEVYCGNDYLMTVNL